MKKLQWVKRQAILTDMQMVYLLTKGDAYLVIWYLLEDLAASINDDGKIYVSPSQSMTVEFLAKTIRRSKKQVEKALDVYEAIDLLAREEAGNLQLLTWNKIQDYARLEKQREQNRQRQAKYRERHGNDDSPRGKAEETGDGDDFVALPQQYESVEKVAQQAVSAGDVQQVMAHYQQSWGQVSPMIAEKLGVFTKQWGSEAVCTAMDIAKENGTNNINYIRAVLENSNGRPQRKESAHDQWQRKVNQCLAELFPENRQQGAEHGEAPVHEGGLAVDDRRRESGAHHTLTQAMQI